MIYIFERHCHGVSTVRSGHQGIQIDEWKGKGCPEWGGGGGGLIDFMLCSICVNLNGTVKILFSPAKDTSHVPKSTPLQVWWAVRATIKLGLPSRGLGYSLVQ